MTSWHDSKTSRADEPWSARDWIILIVVIVANLVLLATGWHL